jgi:hypothetical protein
MSTWSDHAHVKLVLARMCSWRLEAGRLVNGPETIGSAASSYGNLSSRLGRKLKNFSGPWREYTTRTPVPVLFQQERQET